MSKQRYTYKFTDGGFDYFRDNTNDLIVKIPEDAQSRTDEWMAENAIDAENDFSVMEFFS